VAVGRLHPVKGFLRLIRLWKHVYGRTGTVLKIIGGGEQQAELEREIIAQGLENAVILTGAMEHDDVLAEMRKSRIYAMTSFSEGLPFVVIEAMSQGLPAIAYDVRVGPRAIIEDEKNGFLIPEGDEMIFAQKATLVIADSDLWDRMSCAALKRAKDFTEDALMTKWEKLFDRKDD
jgi:glycosyltransferase involved in cell wall biosynthesis